MKVEAVTFDADQTLWDFAGVHRLALESTLALMVERGDVEAGAVSLMQLKQRRDQLASRARSEGRHDLGEVRRASFESILDEHAHSDSATASAELTNHYMQIRFGSIRMYDDVVPTLSTLRDRGLKLGLVTNGNTDPERCGLPGVFDAVVMGPDYGVEKPATEAFELVAAGLDVESDRLLHVGDDADDVDGINALGGVSVLIERDGPRPELRTRAHHVVASLAEIIDLI